MVQSGDIYSAGKEKRSSPWRKRRHKSSPQSKESSPSSKISVKSTPANKSRHKSHSERKALKKQKKRRALIVMALMLLAGYVIYVGMIAMHGIFKYKGPADGISPLAKIFKRNVPVENARAPNVPASVADIDFQEFINRVERSSQIQANILNLLDKGLTANALERIQKSKETLIRSSEINMLIAKAQMGENQYKAAIETFIKVLSSDPGNLDARLHVAEAFAKLGQYEKSVIVAKWAIEMAPTSEKAHRLAAAGYTEMQMHEQAIRHYQSILNNKPGDDEIRSRLAIAYYDTGEYGRAIKYLNKIVQSNTQNSLAYYNLALCYSKQDLVEKVVQTLTYAERKFGKSFVKTWVQGEEFKHLRSDPKFIMFVSQLTEDPAISKLKVGNNQKGNVSATISTSPIEINPNSDALINRNR